jgi:hypothetical protein
LIEDGRILVTAAALNMALRAMLAFTETLPIIE